MSHSDHSGRNRPPTVPTAPVVIWPGDERIAQISCSADPRLQRSSPSVPNLNHIQETHVLLSDMASRYLPPEMRGPSSSSSSPWIHEPWPNNPNVPSAPPAPSSTSTSSRENRTRDERSFGSRRPPDTRRGDYHVSHSHRRDDGRHDRDRDRRRDDYRSDNRREKNDGNRVSHERCDARGGRRTRSDESRVSVSRGDQTRVERREKSPGVGSPSPVVPKTDENMELVTRDVAWTRCCPAEPYYVTDNTGQLFSSSRLKEIQERFQQTILNRNQTAQASKSPFEFPARKSKLHHHHHNHQHQHTSDDDSSSCWSSEESEEDEDDIAFQELQKKKTHPWRLHEELWYNQAGEMNDGVLCRCSIKAKRSGIRHGIYPGEEHMEACTVDSNNSSRLYHYRVVITPLTNYTCKFPTKIPYESHEYIFEGFSLLAHSPVQNYPSCKLIRFNIEYTLSLKEEKFPVNFTTRDLDMITQFIYKEVLELVDINWNANEDSSGCPRFHLFPRFSRLVSQDGKEILSPAIILKYLLDSSKPLIDPKLDIKSMSDDDWQKMAIGVKEMIAVSPGMKPCGIRVDQIDREGEGENSDDPVVVHFGVRPPQLSYAGNPKYQKAWRDYVKFRHLLANKPKVNFADRQVLSQKEEKLQEMRQKSDLKRDVTVEIPAKGFMRTGIFCDVIQHALVIPVVVCHLRFHQSLLWLEKSIGYEFKDRYLLQLALTHPSYRENFGTNPDHARNALTNCGIRQPEYGDRKVHFMNTRKRGINMLINIMARFGCHKETDSNIHHNERLEFLGDAVVEFLSSIHLYFMFPDLEEGGLATYRAAIVQNQHLAVLAKKLHLERFMLYAHGSDLCHDLELRHAMANCFEALMGALFLDGGIRVADRVFSNTLYGDDPSLLKVWVEYPRHPIQRQEPNGDRHLIEKYPRLQQLHGFEELTGIEFTHIRLLARAFTHRSVGYNNLTQGSNQRMEFLGDTVLQLVASEYLYKFFPEHHEGHLSLLRSSLVNNKTQSVVCDDLGMTQFATYNYPKGDLKTKDRADLLEAFLGALYVDKGLLHCRKFCEVCFFPRLEHFILNQDWNDPKSKLQQCCLTLRSLDGGEPDIPIYKVTECLGPTNTREYIVAVRFRNQRLATGRGHSIQEAEMKAAANALKASDRLFPQLTHQKRVIERSIQEQETSPVETKRRRRNASRKRQEKPSTDS